jgi:peptide/nickel transport system ATP-binding protein
VEERALPDPVLSVENLTTAFKLRRGWLPAIEDISFELQRNETLALVGESGCGKSVTAFSIMRLLPEPGSRIDRGRVLLKGQNLLALSESAMRTVRGNQLSMIFQEPMTSLNPVMPVGRQVAEALYYHRRMTWKDAGDKALELLEQVKIPSAKSRINDYPHELSGGMRQRVMIAMALACRPDIILADEPTTALDVTIQAQVLSLMADLKDQRQMSMIFITHDMGVVAMIADRVAVMYAGHIVEMAAVRELFQNPVHPYTEALLKSIPRLDLSEQAIAPIRGAVPPIDRMPAGCRFAERCDYRIPICTRENPRLLPWQQTADHQVRCWVRNPGDREVADA